MGEEVLVITAWIFAYGSGGGESGRSRQRVGISPYQNIGRNPANTTVCFSIPDLADLDSEKVLRGTISAATVAIANLPPELLTALVVALVLPMGTHHRQINPQTCLPLVRLLQLWSAWPLLKASAFHADHRYRLQTSLTMRPFRRAAAHGEVGPAGSFHRRRKMTGFAREGEARERVRRAA